MVHEKKPMDEFSATSVNHWRILQKADLSKISRADQLNVAEQKIYAICWDISQYFRDTFFVGRTPFKGQLVTQ